MSLVPFLKARHQVSQLLSWYKDRKDKVKDTEYFLPIFKECISIQGLGYTICYFVPHQISQDVVLSNREIFIYDIRSLEIVFLWIFLRKKVVNENKHFFLSFSFISVKGACCSRHSKPPWLLQSNHSSCSRIGREVSTWFQTINPHLYLYLDFHLLPLRKHSLPFSNSSGLVLYWLMEPQTEILPNGFMCCEITVKENFPPTWKCTDMEWDILRYGEI